MKKKIVLLVIVLFGTVTFSQKVKTYPKIDSIKGQLSKNSEISLKGHQLLCNYYDRLHHKDSAYIAINTYLHLSKLQKNDGHLVKGMSIKGIYFAKLSELDSARYYLKKVANYPKVTFKIRQEAINNIAITYRIDKKMDSALIYMKKGLQLAKHENYEQGIVNTYIGLSNIYYQQGAYNNRLAYLDSALHITNISKNISYSKSISILHTLGNINVELNNLKKGKKYYFQAIDTCKKNNENFMLFYVNNSLASTYIKEQKLDSASIYLNNNLNHPSFKKNKDILVKTYRRFYELEYKKENYEKALFYNKITLKNSKPKSREFAIANYQRAQVLTAKREYKKALKFLSIINELETHDLELLKDYYKTKFDIHLALKNSIKSNYNLTKFLEIRDSLFSKEKSLISSSLEVKYETQQKENQILSLENEAQKKEISLQKSKTKTNLAVISIFLVVVGGGLYIRKRKKDQKMQLLETSVKSSEQEKKRIGKELHDGIAGGLMTLVHQTETKDVGLSHKLLNSYNQIRDLSHQLNNTSMHGELFMDRLFEIVPEDKENQVFEVSIIPQYLTLEEPYSTHIYRIILELFTNNLKYANASKTTLSLSLEEDVLTLIFADNGKGASEFKKGNGLKSIDNRVTLLNGNLKIDIENGFNVSIQIPLKA